LATDCPTLSVASFTNNMLLRCESSGIYNRNFDSAITQPFIFPFQVGCSTDRWWSTTACWCTRAPPCATRSSSSSSRSGRTRSGGHSRFAAQFNLSFRSIYSWRLDTWFWVHIIVNLIWAKNQLNFNSKYVKTFCSTLDNNI
jgi:hypothetical protein